MGLEPTAFRLEIWYSTIELHLHLVGVAEFESTYYTSQMCRDKPDSSTPRIYFEQKLRIELKTSYLPSKRSNQTELQLQFWWIQRGTIPQPLECKSSALANWATDPYKLVETKEIESSQKPCKSLSPAMVHAPPNYQYVKEHGISTILNHNFYIFQ